MAIPNVDADKIKPRMSEWRFIESPLVYRGKMRGISIACKYKNINTL